MDHTLQQHLADPESLCAARALPAGKWTDDWLEQMIDDCFGASRHVRYVAVYSSTLVMRARDCLSGTSSAESDKYEELLVNPALIKLAGQRGSIDCGGLRFLIIRYGHFFQCVFPTPTGHVSVALEPAADLSVLPDQLARLIDGTRLGRPEQVHP
jgi:hypothetical protein